MVTINRPNDPYSHMAELDARGEAYYILGLALSFGKEIEQADVIAHRGDYLHLDVGDRRLWINKAHVVGFELVEG